VTWSTDQGIGTTPPDVAEVAADAVRRLNHSTLETPQPATPGWSSPTDVSRVLGSVLLLVERLPQTLEQVGAALASQGQWLEDDRSAAGATDTVQDTLLSLERARLHLHTTVRALDRAVGDVEHLRIRYGISKAPDHELGL
jgi:hypothetical protein